MRVTLNQPFDSGRPRHNPLSGLVGPTLEGKSGV